MASNSALRTIRPAGRQLSAQTLGDGEDVGESVGTQNDIDFLRSVRRWLWAATAACLLLPLLLLPLGDDWTRPVAMFPMANCLLVWMILLFGLRQPLRELAVAKYLYAARSIDGPTMARANEIRLGLKPSYILFFWPFLLIFLSWIVLIVVKVWA